jgi:hypothetical protein
MHAAVLHAVADHPSLQAAHKIAGISSSKDQSVAEKICKQSAWMMGQACSGKIQHRNRHKKSMMPSRLP